MKIYRIATDYQRHDNDDYDVDSERNYELGEQGEQVFNDAKIRPNNSKEVKDLALEDGTVIGATAWGWDTDQEEAVFSFDIAIKEEFRNKGVGTNLIERAISEFESERNIYEEMGMKTYMLLDAVNMILGEFIAKSYNFIIQQRMKDRLILYRD